MYLYNRTDGSITELLESFSFGREVGDITFPDDDVMSTRHGKFLLEGGKAFIMDTGSTNGTFVNSEPIEANDKVELNEFDSILCGEQEIFFLVEPESDPDAIEEILKKHKAQKLLSKVQAGKEKKVTEIQSQMESLKKEYEGYRAELLKIKEQFSEYEKEFKEVSAKQSQLDKRAKDIKDNLPVHQQNIEKEKFPHYERQTDFQDKLQLLKTAGAPEADMIPVQKELAAIEEEIGKIELRKVNLPKEADKIQAEADKWDVEKKELHKICLEIKQNFETTSKDYNPKMASIKEELEVLKQSLEKAKEVAKGK